MLVLAVVGGAHEGYIGSVEAILLRAAGLEDSEGLERFGGGADVRDAVRVADGEEKIAG